MGYKLGFSEMKLPWSIGGLFARKRSLKFGERERERERSGIAKRRWGREEEQIRKRQRVG